MNTHTHAHTHTHMNRGAIAATRSVRGRQHPNTMGAKLWGQQRRSAPPCQKARIRKSQYKVALYAKTWPVRKAAAGN